MTDRLHARQQSGSFLVRCWAEPREVAGQPEVMRIYVRDLRSGEEHYISDPSSLGEMLQRGLQEARSDTSIPSGTEERTQAG